MTDARDDDLIHPTGFKMSEVSCSRCLYFHPGAPEAAGQGLCWRFPARVVRHRLDWCGEFDRGTTQQ